MGTNERTVRQVIDSVKTMEGGGFVVRRPFPTEAIDHVDPFLLLDEMGPVELPPGEAKGAPDHPHRGFETVSYILEGAVVHKDSQGNSGRTGPGGVQWMTAGAGVVHSEMPEESFQRSGGRMHGFQIWVNLPARDKMMKPRYQEIAPEKLPTATSADGRVKVKVVAGESMGVSAAIDTRTPITYLHFTIAPGGQLSQSIPQGYNGMIYVMDGAVEVAGRALSEGQLAILAHDGEAVTLANTASTATNFLLLAGQPLNEPVARYGPFVMNRREELVTAFEDFRSGRMGRISH